MILMIAWSRNCTFLARLDLCAVDLDGTDVGKGLDLPAQFRAFHGRCDPETKRDSSLTAHVSSRPMVKPAGESTATHWRLVKVF